MEITYQIDQTDSSNFYLYIQDKDLKKLNLSDEIIDEINSFGVSLEAPMASYLFQEKDPTRFLAERICSRIAGMFASIWDGTLGVPHFRFEGDLNKIDDRFKNRAIFIYFKMNGIEEDDQIEAYKKALGFCTKITFLPRNESSSFFSIITQDHNFAISWLGQRKYDLHHARLQSDKYNIPKRMKDWYPEDEIRNALIEQAKEVVANFLLTKKLDLYIPDFLIVPAFHIRRYQKAQAIVNTVYRPLFVMPLPMVFNEKHNYTILIPVCKDVGRRTRNVVSD